MQTNNFTSALQEEENDSLSRKLKRVTYFTYVLVVLCVLLSAVIITLLISFYFPTSQRSTHPSYWTTNDERFGHLIFDEEFNDLNLNRWQHELTLSGGGNWEFEYYTNNRSNSYVKDGVLYLKSTLTNNTFTAPDFLTTGSIDLWGGQPGDVCTSNAFWGCFRTGTATNLLNSVQSARLRTINSFSFKYGRVEIRAQMPRGDWLWPAIWMLPTHESYGNWPASGEIDIIESRGNDKLKSGTDGTEIGSNLMGSTVHWGPYYGADRYPMSTKTYSLPNGALFSAGFHNWTMDWTPAGINVSVDGTLYFTTETPSAGYWSKGEFDSVDPGSDNPWKYSKNKNAPFDQEFYLILNVATGGVSGFFPEGSVSSPTGLPSYTMPWSNKGGPIAQKFWNDVGKWYPTWYPFKNGGESNALKVDYIRVYEYVAS